MPIRTQDAVDFTQNAVWIVMRFQYMGQQDDVDRVIRDSEAIGRRHQIDALAGLNVHRRSSLRAGGPGEILAPPAADLQKLITEYAVERTPNATAFFAQ